MRIDQRLHTTYVLTQPLTTAPDRLVFLHFASDGRATPSRHQIVRHMRNDGAPRVVRNEIVG
jgi:hypothetical protein